MANTMEAPWWAYYQKDIDWEHLTFVSLDEYNNMPNHLEPSYLETYPGNIYIVLELLLKMASFIK